MHSWPCLDVAWSRCVSVCLSVWVESCNVCWARRQTDRVNTSDMAAVCRPNIAFNPLGGPKIGSIFLRLNFIKILTDSRNCFTVIIRRKFAIIPSLMVIPHLKCVATLLCEISLSRANYHSVLLFAPLVIGVASLNASYSSNVDTQNVGCKNCRMRQLL